MEEHDEPAGLNSRRTILVGRRLVVRGHISHYTDDQCKHGLSVVCAHKRNSTKQRAARTYVDMRKNW